MPEADLCFPGSSEYTRARLPVHQLGLETTHIHHTHLFRLACDNDSEGKKIDKKANNDNEDDDGKHSEFIKKAWKQPTNSTTALPQMHCEEQK